MIKLDTQLIVPEDAYGGGRESESCIAIATFPTARPGGGAVRLVSGHELLLPSRRQRSPGHRRAILGRQSCTQIQSFTHMTSEIFVLSFSKSYPRALPATQAALEEDRLYH